MQRVSVFLILILSVVTLIAKNNTFTVSFGSGGGFTGGSVIYSLDNTGTLYKQEKLGSNLNAQKQVLAKLKKKEVKAVEKLIEAVNFPGVNINNTGNMSQFVNLTQKGKDYKTIWSGSGSGNASLDQLYQKLNSLVPKK